MTKYSPNIHHRKSIRLKGYDYSQAGLYFITICVKGRMCLFGNVVDDKMILNDAGKMVNSEWMNLCDRFTNIKLHEFVVMPNHFHAFMEIVGATLVVAPNEPVVSNETVAPNEPVVSNETGQPSISGQPQETGHPHGIAPTKPKAVGDMVGAFQSIVTVEYIRGVKNLGWKPFNGKLWQRNYWEHIIRNEQSYQRISDYIINNPQNWDKDKFNNS